ncbi:ESCRT-0 subunit protein hse1 [Sporothrix bragantina]|uniref:Class E vacuolar protein-sorting machinery protein HSE1 n=1 Tax=Sporothrix bragantina TaxID=671064 RepID=A0ABP0C226_9PEZI
MFRAAAPGPFDEAVGKATDENATSEDWSAILEVCDRVSSDPANGPKEAVQSLIKRLAHRNANVQLYTLELANALSQNCGTPLHRELASRAFTDALLKLANDRNTHNLVRLKILERMKEWSEMFRSNTDLGIMQDAYSRLQHSQPQLHVAPSAPQKNSLTEADRQREEEDLQRALKLSLEDEASKKQAAPGGGSSSTGVAAGPSGAGSSRYGDAGAAAGGAAATGAAAQAPSQGTTAATVSRVRALFDFAASEQDELDFKKGDVIAVLESVYRDWWRGSLKGRTGIFPLNYVEILADPTPDELQREAQMEAEVFAEIKNVEKLLTLLSASNAAPREEDTDEISKLYHQTLAIRPKLIKLIEKYSQKKDDFTQLNEKFIKARRDYEALLESSMAHPPQPNYQQYAMHQQHIPPQGYQLPPGTPHVAPHAGYAVPGASQQPPDQRYYTPGPQRQDQQKYPQSPSPNMHRPSTTAVPSAFYLANAEIPPAQQPQQQQQQHQPPAPQHHQQQQQPPTQQQAPYPPQSHQQGQRIPSGSGPSGPNKQPSPLQTNIAPAQQAPTNNNTYLPYNPHQGSVSGPSGPSSTYGNPQELSTSAYDSPIASHNPNAANIPPAQQQQQQQPTSANTYSSSVYSPDQFGPPSVVGLPTGPPPPAETTGVAPNPPYQPYTGYPGSQQYQPQPPQSSAPAPPTSSPPPAPSSGPGGSPNAAGVGGYYDSRQSLPSRMSTSGPSAPGGGPGSPPPDQQQYRPYVPPSEASAPQQGSAPPADDYYRQAGRAGY